MRMWTKSLVWIVAMASIVSGIALLSRIPSTPSAEAPVDAVYRLTHFPPGPNAAVKTFYSDVVSETPFGAVVIKDKADGLWKVFVGGALRLVVLKPEETPLGTEDE